MYYLGSGPGTSYSHSFADSLTAQAQKEANKMIVGTTTAEQIVVPPAPVVPLSMSEKAMSWVTKNPLIIGGIAAGALFLILSKKKR